CEVVVAFGMPYETLLGAICHSIPNAQAIGRFFRELCAVDEAAVRKYVDHFVARLCAEVDFGSSELEAKPEFRGTPIDFPRPSPALRFLLPAFFAELASVRALRKVIAPLSIRLGNPDTAR